LCAVIARALSPDPAERYPSADAFRAAIDPFIDRAAAGSGITVMMRSLFGRRPEPWLREPEPVAIPLAPAKSRSGRVARIATPSLLALAAIVVWQLFPASSRPSAAATAKPSTATAILQPLPPLAIPLPDVSRDVIDHAAAVHARELTSCGRGATHHGEVTIAFTVDASGTVEHAQADAVDENHEVAACILRSVQHWKLGNQSSNGAHGTYAVVFD
jgi:hypothetical protein